MKFEYYVLNYSDIEHKVEMFNIFDNWHLQEETETEIRKYLRSPSQYYYRKYDFNTKEYYYIYGFDGLCETIQSLIMWQEWSRVEYEIFVGDVFEDDLDKFEKWDCYAQCKPNIPMIAREVIWQYKQQIKKEKEVNG